MSSKLHKIIFVLLILLFPSQLNYFFWPDFSFVNGVRVDYLAPAIYFLDFLIILFIATSKADVFTKINKKFVIVFLLIFLINTIFSLSPLVTVYRFARIALFILLGLSIFFDDQNHKFFKSALRNYLPVTLLWLLILSLLQFTAGKSVGGLFYFLGERSFNISSPSISQTVYFGNVFLSPYATLPHPNVLMAIFFGTFLALTKINKNRYLSVLIFLFCTTIFLLTQTYYVFLIGLFLFLNKVFLKIKTEVVIILSVLIFAFLPQLVSYDLAESMAFPPSVAERALLLTESTKIILEYPIIGVGLGNHLTKVGADSTYSIPHLFERYWLQPVHNVWFLLASELGLVVIALLIFLTAKFLRKRDGVGLLILFVLLTSLLDHFWITLYQPLLFLALVVPVVEYGNNKKEVIESLS